MTPAQPNLETYSGRFGARLRELRLKAKLTQAELADLVGVSKQAVSTWELGTRSPATDMLPDVANALKLKKISALFPDA